MPIYEYNCPGCGTPFEKRVSFSESDSTQECPQCGNPYAKRQISLIGGMKGSSTGTSLGSGAACGPVG